MQHGVGYRARCARARVRAGAGAGRARARRGRRLPCHPHGAHRGDRDRKHRPGRRVRGRDPLRATDGGGERAGLCVAGCARRGGLDRRASGRGRAASVPGRVVRRGGRCGATGHAAPRLHALPGVCTAHCPHAGGGRNHRRFRGNDRGCAPARARCRKAHACSPDTGTVRLLATDGAERFARIGATFLGRRLEASDIEIVDLATDPPILRS